MSSAERAAGPDCRPWSLGETATLPFDGLRWIPPQPWMNHQWMKRAMRASGSERAARRRLLPGCGGPRLIDD